MKRWKLAEPAPREAAETLGKPRLLASLLWRRGIRTPEDADVFLRPDWDRDVHDPFLFKDMEKAVGRLLAAAKDGEKIVIHGDYDADGVSASVILHTTLKKLGADVSVHLPHREKDGYGISPATVEKLASEGTTVMITCDCGISNGKEIALANERGIDTVITDHHTLPAELPAAYAILHPLREGETYPFRYLTGGGVAFKLAQALWKRASLPEGQDKWLVDMAAISTVADLGALTGENRALVRYGLTVLAKSRRPGLARLVESAGGASREVDAGMIGFQIAPRINAAGRMDHANGAFNLLVAETQEEIATLSETIDRHNLDRRAATDVIVKEARRLATEQKDAAAVVVAGDGWPAALAGLAAAKLVDDSYRPAIVLGRDVEGKYVGSGRSIAEFDVTAALHACSAHLLKFGGHPRACGLTIQGDENFEAFKKAFQAYAEEKLKGIELIPTLTIEEELSLDEATLANAEGIAALEPHGEGNPKPLFLVKHATLATVQPVGKDGKHLRMTASDGRGNFLPLIAFNAAPRPDAPSAGDAVDLVVELGINEWNGRKTVQGRVVDFRQGGG